MTPTHLNSALIVGAGAGLSASLARALAKDGIKVALAARSTSDLAALAQETGAETFACDASRRDDVDEAVRRRSTPASGAPDIVDLQCELPHARAARRARSGRGREGDRRHRLRRLPGGAAGGAAHAAEEARSDPAHRRLRRREGLSAVGAVRDGQVRAARPRPEHGARAALRKASTSPMSSSTAASGARGAAEPPDAPEQPARPRRHRRHLPAPDRSSRAAPGRGRSRCGPGWRGSDRESSPHRKIEIGLRERLVGEREVPPFLLVGREAAARHGCDEQRAVLLRLEAHALVRQP